MNLLRGCFYEALMLHRRLRVYPPLVLVVLVAVLAVQEGPALRGQLFCRGLETALALLIGLLPIAWLGTRRGPGLPAGPVIGPFLGVLAYGLVLIALTLTLAFTACRIFPLAPFSLIGHGYAAVSLLLPVAAFAPACAVLPSRRLAVVGWFSVLASSFVAGFPIPTADVLACQPRDTLGGSVPASPLGPLVMATSAGLMVSLAFAPVRTDKTLHAHRNPGRHP